MDIYYLASDDETPEDENDWDIWNLIIPTDGKMPGIGDSVIMYNNNVGPRSYKIDVQDDVTEWPFRFTSSMKNGVVKAIFGVR